MLRLGPSVLSRSFADDKLRPELVQKLLDMGQDYADARSFRSFSYKEMKKAIPAELWEKVTKDDPISKYPELTNFTDVDDVLPQNNPRLPPHLTRPIILLNERQAKAQRMTLDFSKKEYKLKIERDAAVDQFQAVTTDGYEVNIGLLIAREPLFVSIHPKDHEFSLMRHKVWNHHNLYMVAEESLTDYDYVPDEDATEEEVRRRAITKKRLEEGKPYEYAPGSLHHLDANPNESDPHSIQFAAGNRVFLLFKDKVTKKWAFPVVPALGKRSLDTIKEEIRANHILRQIKLHHLGPLPMYYEKKEYALTKTVDRPRGFDEELFDMFFQRTKLLFPNTPDDVLRHYVEVRHQMKFESQKLSLEVRGSKTFYFQSILISGDIKKIADQYEDWAWVPKAQLSSYLTKEDFIKANAVVTNY